MNQMRIGSKLRNHISAICSGWLFPFEGCLRYLLVLGLVASTAAGCGGKRIRVPPAIDLSQHEIIGVIEIASSSKGKLGRYTTDVVIEEMREDQGLIRIVTLGPQAELLAVENLSRLDRAAYQTIGDRHGLNTIVVGTLDVSNVRPVVRLSPDLGGISAAADVDARLNLQLIDTESGASIWSRSAEATRRVGHVSLVGGGFDFNADDPDRAYGELVRALAEMTTVDFKDRWEKR